MIKTAVILAAGLGSRLKDLTKNKPKGFLEVGGVTLIERSIRKLLDAGITKIIIGTGYLKDSFNEYVKKYPQIKCVENKDYASTGSMFTLYNLRNEIHEDFLLLESDLLYEKAGLNTLMSDLHSDVILASGETHSHDEVFIQANTDNELTNMSKDRSKLSHVSAELVGISKISLKTFQSMCHHVEKRFASEPKLDYEYAMVGVSQEHPFYIRKIEDYAWIEIDDTEHMKRAINNVLPLIQFREKHDTVVRNVLLNPGPATTTDSVKWAQVVPDICPREKEFGELMEFVSTELTSFVGSTDDYITVLMGGSGTAAVETIISSVIDTGTVLIINNGAYGVRMCQMAKIYGYNVIEFESSTEYPIDLVKLEDTIKSNQGKITHLAAVHNETTTGLLNDIHTIGAICKKYDIKFIVDAMSSYAAIPIDMKEMNISFLAASSNKNIQGMAGVGFIIANRKDLEATKNIKPRTLYLHLYGQYEYFLKNYQMRFTPPVQTLYALKQAIIEAKMEGIENRYARYSKCWETLLKGLDRLGLKYQVPREAHGKIITSILEPEHKNYNFDAMHDYLYERGFTIYPGKVANKNCFRVANIGAITYLDMENFLALLEEYLVSIGYRIPA